MGSLLPRDGVAQAGSLLSACLCRRLLAPLTETPSAACDGDSSTGLDQPGPDRTGQNRTGQEAFCPDGAKEGTQRQIISN